MSNKYHRVIALIGTWLILVTLPCLLFFSLTLKFNDPGGPLLWVIVPCVNCFLAILLLPFVWLITEIAGKIHQKYPQTWIGSLLSPGLALILLLLALIIIIGAYALLIILIRGDFGLESTNDTYFRWLFTFLFIGGIPVLLGIPIYWLLSRLTKPRSTTPNDLVIIDDAA